MRQAAISVAILSWFLTAGHPAHSQTNSLRDLIHDDFVVGASIYPQQVWQSPLVQQIATEIDPELKFDDEFQQLTQRMGFDPREIVEAAVLMDSDMLHQMFGISSSELEQDPFASEVMVENFKQIAIACHNYHDTFKSFPPDGPSTAVKGELSWRVHILPFLDQQALYDQFHLEEPWDSEHNRSLIDKMPKVFKTPGMQQPGETTLLRFTKEMSGPSGKGGVRFRDITDGTTNTLMAVVAGADKSQPWTQPDDLQWQAGPAANSLGKISDSFFAIFCDGSVSEILADVQPETFRRMVHRGDSLPLDDREGRFIEFRKRKPHRPLALILKSATEVNAQRLLALFAGKESPDEHSQVGESSIITRQGVSLVVIDPKTVLVGPKDLVPKLLTEKSLPKGIVASRLRANSGDIDLLGIADLRDMQVLRNKLATLNPMSGLIESVEAVEFKFDVAGTEPDLLIARVVMSDADAAERLNTLLSGLVQMQKFQMVQANERPGNGEPNMLQPAIDMIDQLSITNADKLVTIRFPKPKDVPELIEQLKPGLAMASRLIQQSREIRSRFQRSHHLKQIALAMHNYHDKNRSFPRHDGDGAGQKMGLSWRVHLLPQLGYGPLYDQFNFDQPWDSEHNRKLIQQMPPLFKVAGVSQPGHTSVHVFTGPKTPFGNKYQPVRFRDIIDGTSYTILAIQAGPSTAHPWTKPGGLQFDGSNAIEVLGDVGDLLTFSMMDGSVHSFEKPTIAQQLPLLIMHQDQTPVSLPGR